MFTVNLEKKLIKQNQKLITPKELLVVNEYDKFKPLAEDTTLSRVGLNRNIKEGALVISRLNLNKVQTSRFNQEKVFHKSQIQSLCNKYYLRFLNVGRYNGSLDENLAEKITTFETAYNVLCYESNLYIMAPASSFKLEEKPKDPLLFYKLNDEYYYLICKWGNDLNIWNRIKSILSNPYIFFITLLFTFISILTLCIKYIHQNMVGFSAALSFLGLFTSIVLGILLLFTIGFIFTKDAKFRFVTKNKWDDYYI